MGSKREGEADRALVGAYHEARLGSSSASRQPSIASAPASSMLSTVDEVLHQRAARELWKFCWLPGDGAGVEPTARVVREIAAEGESIDWWQLGARRDRRAQRR